MSSVNSEFPPSTLNPLHPPVKDRNLRKKYKPLATVAPGLARGERTMAAAPKTRPDNTSKTLDFSSQIMIIRIGG